MRLFSTGLIVGSIARSTIATAKTTPPSVAVNSLPESPVPEYDEAGRLYVSRFKPAAPQRPIINRDRIFEYTRKRRRTVDDPPRWLPFLPTEDTRRYLRDVRNSANFFEDVRELQTHADIRVVPAFTEVPAPRLRAG
jgi:hypothetical protein